MNRDQIIGEAIYNQLFNELNEKTIEEIRVELKEKLGEKFTDIEYSDAYNHILVECGNTLYKINSLTLQMYREEND